MIAVETVLMARELIKASTKEQFDEWIRWFFDTQPDVLDFLVERTRGRKENIRELALFLALFIFKAYDLEHPGKTVTPSRTDLAVALDQMTDWMRRLGGDGFADSHRETEPFLLILSLRNWKNLSTTELYSITSRKTRSLGSQRPSFLHSSWQRGDKASRPVNMVDFPTKGKRGR
jgi:hypothetical protein